MSYGHQISDGRSYKQVYGNNYAAEGELYEKTWSGANWDPVTRRREEHEYSMSVSQTFYSLIEFWHDQMFGGYNHQKILWSMGSFSPFVYASDQWTSNDELKILTKLGNKARSNEFNGANFIAEIHQPIKMISSLAEDAASLLYGLRKGQLKQAKRLAADIRDFGVSNNASRKRMRDAMKVRSARQFVRDLKDNIISEEAMAERVLLVQYGIRPLLADMHDGAEAIARVVNDKYFDQGLSQWIKVKRTVVNDRVDTSTFNNVLNQKTVHMEAIRARLISRPSTLTLLHVNDPLSALWESTAWSFVADWVIPIGSWLSALDTIQNFEWGECWRTSYVTKECSFGIFNSPGANGAVTRWPDQFPMQKDVTLSRSRYNIASSSFIPPVPNIKTGIVPEHWLNGISLLIGAKSNIAKTLKY